MSTAKQLTPILAALLVAGCPGTGDDLSEADGLIRSVQLKGRVVDFESCIAKTGCMGVAGVKVALFYNRQHVTAKTPSSGAFTLRVPDGVPLYLYVLDAGAGTYLPTLTASPITTTGADIYNAEVFVLRRSGGLYEGIQKDSQAILKRTVSVQSDALYLGQAFKVEKGSMKAIDFVTAHSFPSGTFMYVSCNTRFKECKGQKTLGGGKATTIFGQFIKVGKSGKGDYAVWATSKSHNFGPVMAPIGPGYISIGTHKGTKK